MSRCGQCAHFLGMGDWSLCCTEQYYLCRDIDEACDKFEQTDVCRNVSNLVGGFFCSICGAYGWDSIVLDGVHCPKCGSEITGALFNSSFGWRGDGQAATSEA